MQPPAEVPVRDRCERVRGALRHLWQGYRAKAWGADEIRPVSGIRAGGWGEVGMTILDTLDTLWITGLREEFGQGEQWVSEMAFTKLQRPARTSFFEMVIRGLAGLLSAHALSGRAVFLQKATAMGNNLLPGFSGRTLQKLIHSWPVSYIDVHNPDDVEVTPSFHSAYVALADAGTNVLEFAQLTRATGDAKYRDAAEGTMTRLMAMGARRGQHLLPKHLNPRMDDVVAPAASVGAEADSYFEYLLKRYHQGGNLTYLHSWKSAMSEMRARLIHTSPTGFNYIAMDTGDREQMDHITCFVPGMLALGSHIAPKEHAESWWLELGEELGRTCYEMYRLSASGLAPETVRFGVSGMTMKDRSFRLRPETLESLFYLYRVTGNEKYRTWSWEIFQSIERGTKAPFGFSSVQDVDVRPPLPLALTDSQETFMSAETLKYAYLAQATCPMLDLRKVVFNTEAHPFPVDGARIAGEQLCDCGA